jgi:hypothetical protein
MTKLPEPLKTFEYVKGKCQDLYSEAQMLQFRRDALDEAAKSCDSLAHYGEVSGVLCAKAIRKLKDET